MPPIVIVSHYANDALLRRYVTNTTAHRLEAMSFQLRRRTIKLQYMLDPRHERISLADFLKWEQQQPERFEWIDGTIVPCAGVSFEHATIATNLSAIFHMAVAGGARGRDLGSFYADLFVSCVLSDRTGKAAHFPTVVVEILSEHMGREFTTKKRAYLGSANLRDYLIVDSTSRCVYRFSWKQDGDRLGLFTSEQQHGPVGVPSLALDVTFDQIYAGTDVPAIPHPIRPQDEETEVFLD